MKIENIIHKLGIQLNEMQQAAMEAMLNGKDNMIVLSPTGSGKTLAYLLPLTQLLDAQSDEVQAVVVVPGRELALQSATVLKDMGSGLRGMACYGGRAAMDEHRRLREVKPQIVFATPGRLNDHLDKGNLLASDIRFLILDEFDKCLEMGFHDEMQALMSKVPKEVRSILLSATPAEELGDQKIVNSCFKVLNFLPEAEQVPDRVHIYKVESPTKDKLETLQQLLLSFGGQSTIVFYHIPESEDGYIHRVGRTARWDKQGRAFFILNSQEQIPAYVDAEVEDYAVSDAPLRPALPRNITLYIGKGKKDKVSKADIVGFLCKKGGLRADEIGRIDVYDRYAYAAVARDKAKQVLRLTKGEKIKGIRTVVEEVR